MFTTSFIRLSLLTFKGDGIPCYGSFDQGVTRTSSANVYESQFGGWGGGEGCGVSANEYCTAVHIT
jgi:hypothetical protein